MTTAPTTGATADTVTAAPPAGTVADLFRLVYDAHRRDGRNHRRAFNEAWYALQLPLDGRQWPAVEAEVRPVLRAALLPAALAVAVAEAERLGREAGDAAGRDLFDGNTDRDIYERCVRLAEDGDPAWSDEFGPAHAPLSGEWADDRTEAALLAETGVRWLFTIAKVAEVDRDEPAHEVSSAYEAAFGEGYEHAVTGWAAEHLTD